jgi:hypothetical protein
LVQPRKSALGDGDDPAPDPNPGGVIRAGIAREPCTVGYKGDPHFVTTGEQEPRYDETVSPVVAGAANDEHRARVQRELPDDVFRGAAAGIFHEHEARHGTGGRMQVEGPHLMPRKNGEHALLHGKELRAHS